MGARRRRPSPLARAALSRSVLQLAATLHNRPKDELDGADIRNQRHTRLLAASGLIAMLLASLFAFRQTRVSHEESLQNLAASLAANSAKVLTDSPDRAIELARPRFWLSNQTASTLPSKDTVRCGQRFPSYRWARNFTRQKAQTQLSAFATWHFLATAPPSP